MFQNFEREKKSLISHLAVRFRRPRAAHVGRAIVQDRIKLGPTRRPAQRRRRRRGRDVADQGLHARDRPNLVQVDADDEGGDGQGLGRDLEPAARCRAQVEHRPAFLQEAKLAVELDELEGGAGPETRVCVGWMERGMDGERSGPWSAAGLAAGAGGSPSLLCGAAGMPASSNASYSPLAMQQTHPGSCAGCRAVAAPLPAGEKAEERPTAAAVNGRADVKRKTKKTHPCSLARW